MPVTPVNWKDQSPALLLAALGVLVLSGVLDTPVLELVMTLGLLVLEWSTMDLEEECMAEVCMEATQEASHHQQRQRHPAPAPHRKGRRLCRIAQCPRLL